MNDKKKKLIEEKDKIETKITQLQNRLKSINQKIKNIELEEKAKTTDQILKLIEGKGINNIDEFVKLMEDGKISINDFGNK
jgi:predicted  nucleic acid-binding Zn-ribbon protein